MTFKLKEQIDIDKLIKKQYFEFKQSFTRNGKVETSLMKCKIHGLRSEAFKEHLARKDAVKNSPNSDGLILVRISGCEYNVRNFSCQCNFDILTWTILSEIFYYFHLH